MKDHLNENAANEAPDAGDSTTSKASDASRGFFSGLLPSRAGWMWILAPYSLVGLGVVSYSLGLSGLGSTVLGAGLVWIALRFLSLFID